jgi:hypothetical protein
MIICEFCLQYRNNGECAFGLNQPKTMGCREFDPGIEKFCADPKDFKGAAQIIEMATFFGVKGTELKKIKLIAKREEKIRSSILAAQTESLAVSES